MAENKLGKLTTFPRLMQEESVIMIPKVQRDYAYGRKEAKVEAVLDTMLETMLDAVRLNDNVIFDFVYGGSYIKKGDENSGLIPLDGQQRLTTLFLLYFYASLVQPGVTSEDVKWLKKFRYETRQSATDFCELLIDTVRDYLLSRPKTFVETVEGGKEVEGKSIFDNILEGKTSLAAEISGHPKFMPSYDSDPTICSMLNVLERIHSKHKSNPISDIWTRLMTGDNIRFYSLSLDKFGLTDDLYIKMNSRGKKLTPFEIFKSDLEKAVAKIDENLKGEIAQKLDNAWMDIVWDFANPTLDLSDQNRETIVRRADEGYMHLFDNILRLELFRRNIEPSKNRHATIEEIFTDVDAVKQVMSYLDTISSIRLDDGGIEANWEKYFYFSDAVCGQDNKIRLFWDKNNRKPVIHLAMEGDLTVTELIYFYALYLIKSRNYNYADAFNVFRLIRNLINANIRVNRAQYNMLHGFFKDIEHIVDTKGHIEKEKSTFVGPQWLEEQEKILDLPSDIYDSLLRFENHDILRGSLALFMKEYPNPIELQTQLKHFEEIFGQNAKDDFNTLKSNLLDSKFDYMQATSEMIKDKEQTKRFFIHHYDSFRNFFIANDLRPNQDIILKLVARLPSAQSIKTKEEKCKDFSIYDWQYYMIKYPDSSSCDTDQGYCTWDDRENRPLEIIILNSSSHSSYNIEWKMLNNILLCEIWDKNVKYSLDYHGSSPLALNKLGCFLDMKQEGWQLECKDPEKITALHGKDLYSITPKTIKTEEGEPALSKDTFIVDFKNNPDNLDYIELAKQLIADLEAAYAAKQQSQTSNQE